MADDWIPNLAIEFERLAKRDLGERLAAVEARLESLAVEVNTLAVLLRAQWEASDAELLRLKAIAIENARNPTGQGDTK